MVTEGLPPLPSLPPPRVPITALTEDPRHHPRRSHRGGNQAGHGSDPSGQARKKGLLETRNRPLCHPSASLYHWLVNTKSLASQTRGFS